MITVTRAGEAKLIETLGELTDQLDSWTVVCFHFSRLLEEYRTEYQLKIAMNLALDLMQALQGGIYMCTNGDMAVLARNLMPTQMSKLVFQLRYLYMDDPLAYTAEGDDNPDFCRVFPLATEFKDCLKHFNKHMMASIKQLRMAPKTQEDGDFGGVFDASGLASIEKQLSTVDVLAALRKQAVCTFTGPVQVRKVFEEMYIHIPHLRELLRTRLDVFSNKWLFKYITQLLDKRVLETMAEAPTQFLQSALSINVNMETLLSQDLTRLDTVLTPAQKVGLMFEVPVVDAFADAAAFAYACAEAQKLGYRVCLDGLSELSFRQVKRELLGVDLLKLQWNASHTADAQRAQHSQIRQAVEACGPSRVILCRCDSSEAVAYGQSLGISLFQGRFIDQLIDPQREMKN